MSDGSRTPVVQYREDEENNGGMANCCKSFMKALFSHIGITAMVILYSLAGAYIFQILEQTNEKQLCIEAKTAYDPMHNETILKLWEISAAFYPQYVADEEVEEEALTQIKGIITQFRDDVLDLGHDGEDCERMGEVDGPEYLWNFPMSLLFAVTIITTIGYGNIAPKTFYGRLVCIAYAVLGIPLMLLCLANIGDVMADIFRFVYSKICCCGFCKKKNKNKVNSLEQDGPRAQTPEAWKKDYKGEKQGLPPSQDPVILEDDDDDDDDEEAISVPLTITMGVIGFFILMGALLFGTWEGWEPLTAAYFCFVTISTIGFGDYVPGAAHFENAEDKYKMIFSAVYITFGMAILSMCFSLIQEEIVAKFKWLGEKIGIVEKDQDEDDDADGDDNRNDPEDPQTPPPKK